MNDEWDHVTVLLANLAGLLLAWSQKDGVPPARVMWFHTHRVAYRVARWANRAGLRAEAAYWRSVGH